MKFLVIAEPNRASLPKDRHGRSGLVEGAKEFGRSQEASGQVEANYSFEGGGGFAIVNADSEQALRDSLHRNPMAPHVRYDIRPLVEFQSGVDARNADAPGA